MLRGDWRWYDAAGCGLIGLCLALGAIGVSLSKQPQPDRYQSYRYAPGDPEAANAALLNKTRPVEYRKPCERPEGHDESDLCAQWKAARAAEAGALWTERGFWVGLIGAVGLAITIILNMLQTRAAVDALEQSRLVSFAELRPWIKITVENEEVILESNGWIKILFTVKFLNNGKTVADNVRSYVSPIPGEATTDNVAALLKTLRSKETKTPKAIAPGDYIEESFTYGYWLNGWEWGTDGRMKFVIVVQTRYDSQFARRSWAEQAFIISHKRPSELFRDNFLWRDLIVAEGSKIMVKPFFTGEVS